MPALFELMMWTLFSSIFQFSEWQKTVSWTRNNRAKMKCELNSCASHACNIHRNWVVYEKNIKGMHHCSQNDKRLLLFMISTTKSQSSYFIPGQRNFKSLTLCAPFIRQKLLIFNCPFNVNLTFYVLHEVMLQIS